MSRQLVDGSWAQENIEGGELSMNLGREREQTTDASSG
jgi:hypothetical protein